MASLKHVAPAVAVALMIGVLPVVASTAQADLDPLSRADIKDVPGDQTAEEFELALGVPLSEAGGGSLNRQAEEAIADVRRQLAARGMTEVAFARVVGQRQIDVYLDPGVSAEDVKIPDMEVRFINTTFSQASASALQERILVEMDVWRAQGLDIWSTSSDVSSGAVLVWVEPSDSAPVAKFERDYGAQVQVIEKGRTLSRSATRSTDYSPWYGGNYFNVLAAGSNAFLGRCSTSFAVLKSTNDYSLSAGHCFNATGDRAQYYWTEAIMGHASQRDFVSGAPADTSLIAGEYAPFVWNSATTFLAQRVASSSDVKDAPTCFDGGRSGQNCKLKTTSNLNTSFTEGGVTTTGLVQVVSTDGSSPCRPGDSGGPVYDASPGNGIRARGTIVVCPQDGFAGSTALFLPWYRGVPRLGSVALMTP